MSLLTENISPDINFKGFDNVVVDVLSRSVSSLSLDLVDLLSFARLQGTDAELPPLHDKLKYFFLPGILSVWCANSALYPRPLVPVSSLRTFIMGLPDVKASLRLMKKRYLLQETTGEWELSGTFSANPT